MIQYCIEVTIAWTLFYGIYLIFLKRETFFNVNRWYLMHTAWIGALIPLSRFIPLPVMQEHSVMMEPVQVIHYTTYAVSEAMSAAPEQGVINMRSILMSLYILGVVFFSLRFMYGLRNIYRLWKSGEKVKNEGFTLVLSDKYHLPFSFLNCVFLHRSFLENASIKEILDHEMIHVKSRHTIDVLFMEILSILFWWNPIIYLYKRELRQTHEYVADAYASQHTYKKNYGRILLGQSSSGIELALTNQFFNSHLKKRITMLYKKKSAHYKLSKYLLVIPVLFFLCVLYSFQDKVAPLEQSQSTTFTEVITQSDDVLPEPIAAELHEALGRLDTDFESYNKEYLSLRKYRYYLDVIQSAFIGKAQENGIYLHFEDDGYQKFGVYTALMPDSEDKDKLEAEYHMQKAVAAANNALSGVLITAEDMVKNEFGTDTTIHNENGDSTTPNYTRPILEICDDLIDIDSKMKCTREELYSILDNNLTYTEEALQEGYQGYHSWDINVDKYGKLINVTYNKGLKVNESYGIKEKAESILNKELTNLNFLSAIKNGEKVSGIIRLSYKMKLSKEQKSKVVKRGAKDVGNVFQNIYFAAMTPEGNLSFFINSNLNTTTNVKVYDPNGFEIYNQDLPYYYKKTHDSVTVPKKLNGTYTAVMTQDGKEVKTTMPVTLF